MRIVNRMLAFVAALALAVAGIITIVEVVGERVFSTGPIIIDWRAMLRWGQHNTWQAMSVELACGATALIGLILVLLQIRRRRPSRIPLRASDHTTVALTRSGMATTVRSAVLDVEGISRARVKVKHRRIAIKGRTAAATGSEAKAATGRVRDAVGEQLEPLGLQHAQRIKVRVTPRSKEDED